ncbi:iron complex outermembrane receptor protein [Pseudomonas sp. SJZ079]|uniref:TonB-dependent receptor family protein n=1 Tax=Pseudomonas sp. SJZ079 TaxID=2572887 RepID=UPI00119BBB6F|nr:TonB-dependent receptor [Pseudomonas sp. SJZ079]TWC36260.1 iron complex outermembrane receptor protein [Pseudomonas sp. SJZ079]
MKLPPIALAVAMAPSLTLAAQTSEPYQAPPLVVTRGTPLQQPAPASVAVITREQIETSAASNLVEVLRTQAGLQIRDTLGDGNRVAISLRGFGENAANNTLVLVDGRRLNNPSQQAADLNSVPLGNIQRIEVIRGAGTVLYGDQAVGGVINIITRTPRENEAYVETSRGSHDLEAYRGHAYRQLGAGFSLYANGEARHADGYRDNNNASYSNAFARLRHDHDGGWLLAEYQTIDDELRLPGALTEAQQRTDRKASFKPRDFSDSKTQVNRFAARQTLAENWAADFDYSYRDSDAKGFLSGAFTQGTRVETFSPRLTAHWDSALGRSEWLLGHDHISSDYELASAFGTTRFRQTMRDWYSQLSQPLSQDLTLTLGYRASEVEDRNQGLGLRHTDHEDSSSLGLSWQASTQTRLFLKREDVLRFANVDDNGFTAPGTTFLKPQTGVSWEGGIEWQDAIQRYQLSLYRLDLHDEIAFDSAAPGPFGPGANVNLDDTRRDGLLLEGRRQLSERLSLNGQYSFTDASYRGGNFKGNDVPWVARHTASLSLSYLLLPGLSSYLEANYTGPRYLSSDDAHTLPRTGGYSLFNAGLSYDYRQFSSRLRLNNLTGKRYNSFAGQSDFVAGNKALYSAPEEEIQLSVGYRF